MNTIEEFLTKYVAINGPSAIKMGGKPINISVEGITETDFETPDIYIVNQIGVDSHIAESVKTFVFARDEDISLNLRSEPQSAMQQALHSIIYKSKNLVVYSTDESVLEEKEAAVDEPQDAIEETQTTIPPDHVEGVPFSISGTEVEDEQDDEPRIDSAW